MTVSLSTVHITVDDPEAALVFYRDTLGLTVSMDVSNGDFRWITLVSDSQPGLGIVLSLTRVIQRKSPLETSMLTVRPRVSR